MFQYTSDFKVQKDRRLKITTYKILFNPVKISISRWEKISQRTTNILLHTQQDHPLPAWINCAPPTPVQHYRNFFATFNTQLQSRDLNLSKYALHITVKHGT